MAHYFIPTLRQGHACRRGQRSQRGVMLLEALVAILIFSIGVLGMVSLGTASVSTQSDARNRTDAANLANDISSQIALAVDRTAATAMINSLSTFVHQPGGTMCNFSGTASGNAKVTAWVNRIVATPPLLPGAQASRLQITLDTTTSVTGYNKLQVTVCWQAPSDKAVRHHTLVTYIN